MGEAGGVQYDDVENLSGSAESVEHLSDITCKKKMVGWIDPIGLEVGFCAVQEVGRQIDSYCL